MLQQMEAIRDLGRLRGAWFGGAFGIRTRPITRDHLHVRMLPEPLRDRGGHAVWEERDFATLDEIIRFHIDSAAQARQGSLRNAARDLQGIALTLTDVQPLARAASEESKKKNDLQTLEVLLYFAPDNDNSSHIHF